jgi:hypothetical protein
MRQLRVPTILFISLFLVLMPITSASSVTSANPYGASPIDPPAANEVILKLSHKDHVINFRFKDLTKIKSSVITIHEPFVKKNQSFTAIPLRALFAKVGITASEIVETRALNDYIYSNTANSFLNADGYLAIFRNGKLIPYDQGGPTRIIFPNSSKWSHFLDPWNWSLMSIAVK